MPQQGPDLEPDAQMIGLKQRILGTRLGTMHNEAVKVRSHRDPGEVHVPDFDARASTRLGLLNNFRQEKSVECLRASNEGSGYRKNRDCKKDYHYHRPIYSASVHSLSIPSRWPWIEPVVKRPAPPLRSTALP
jgi:hypothetical protein